MTVTKPRPRYGMSQQRRQASVEESRLLLFKRLVTLYVQLQPAGERTKVAHTWMASYQDPLSSR